MIRIYYFLGDRIASLLSRCLLSEIGSDYYIHYGEHGKPYIKTEKQIYFNVSHTNNIWLCAFANKPIGIDVENINKRIENKKSISLKMFCESEREYLELHPEAFWKIWTAKESYSKLLGKGIDKETWKESVVSNKKCKKKMGRAYMYQIELENYILSVCSFEKIDNVKFIRIY